MASGLPSLAGSITSAIDTAALDVVAITSFLFPTPAPIYGIFSGQTGAEVLTGYNSVVGLSFQADEKISNYPIEQGGFAAYNKVALPFSGKLSYVITGQAKRAFLAQCEILRADTNTYTLITPDYSWSNVNVMHHDHKRDAQHGFDMLTVDVWMEEVRQANAPQFTNTGTQADPTNTASPDAQAAQSSSNVQPVVSSSGALGANNAAYAQIMGEPVAPPPAVAN